MNSLVSILSTIVSVFLLTLVMAALNRARKAEEENKILWGQVDRYDEYIKLRLAEDDDLAHAATLN